jgi:acylphosphatase
MADEARAHIVIHGDVQGVFFRQSAKGEAEKRNVTGWVKNRPDGSVEAIFEGDKENVDAMTAWCRKGPPRARVKEVAITWQTYTGRFESFDITF